MRRAGLKVVGLSVTSIAATAYFPVDATVLFVAFAYSLSRAEFFCNIPYIKTLNREQSAHPIELSLQQYKRFP